MAWLRTMRRMSLSALVAAGGIMAAAEICQKGVGTVLSKL
jgi:hypothetical protein